MIFRSICLFNFKKETVLIDSRLTGSKGGGISFEYETRDS